MLRFHGIDERNGVCAMGGRIDPPRKVMFGPSTAKRPGFRQVELGVLMKAFMDGNLVHSAAAEFFGRARMPARRSVPELPGGGHQWLAQVHKKIMHSRNTWDVGNHLMAAPVKA